MLRRTTHLNSLCSLALRQCFTTPKTTVSNWKYVSCCCLRYNQVRGAKKSTFGSLFRESEGGKELEDNFSLIIPADSVPKDKVLRILTDFIRRKEVLDLASQQGLNGHQVRLAYNGFRKFCLETDKLPMELHIVLHDIAAGKGHPDDAFPYFMNFALKMYPHLGCREELKKISDLRDPSSWYPMARSMSRKIIFHAGPTNSGKTYHALQRFMDAQSSVYCGPLKMLANEVYQKATEQGIECDLVTGEERIHCNADEEPANRVSCTVEMTSVNRTFDVAVIDEIQMVQDSQRGWAWTRALLGVAADEVHLCGEAAAIPLIKSLLETTGEPFEVREYKRLTPLQIEDTALRSLNNVKPGDCVVCFSKRDIFMVTQELEKLGKEVAVIYGSLPPGTKSAQARKFNDVNDLCSVMVATDAIGMGLNLNIRRVIFYSLRKVDISAQGKKVTQQISVSQALQIAGRAGRYGTQFCEGYVTTFKPRDLPLLKGMLSSLPPPVAKAGLHPTSEQIELFSYHLPNSSLHSLLEAFTELCQMDDSLYFLCNIETFKFLAELLNDLPLPLRARYVFCCAPVNIKVTYTIAVFSKIARQYSCNKAMTADWLAEQVKWPLKEPKNLIDLVTMEYTHDVFDLYLWLSFRFPDIFLEADKVRGMQKELDKSILEGVISLTRLLVHADANTSKVQPILKEKVMKVASNENKFSVAELLLKEGKISQEVLDQLKKEWSNEDSTSNKR